MALESQDNFHSPPHSSSDSLATGSCLHKKNPFANGHLPCSSQPKLNNSNSIPCLFSTLLSKSSPNLNCLPGTVSNACPNTLRNVQPNSNSNFKTFPFRPGCQTNLSTPVQADSDPLHCDPAAQSRGMPTRAFPSPLTSFPLTERVLPVPSAKSSTYHHPPRQTPLLPLTTHPCLPIPCSERPMSRPLKAGGILSIY